MKRIGYISPLIGTKENFEKAFWGYSAHKLHRGKVQSFMQDIERNTDELLNAYVNGTWKTSPYTPMYIEHPKHRQINKLPIKDHVIQWAAANQYEKIFIDTLFPASCSCVPGRGTHYFVKILKDELRNNIDKTKYAVQLDIHHYFPNINHELMKKCYRRKIKDTILLSFLDEIVDSFVQGLPMGIKISQLLANLYLASFDRLALRCFDIELNTDKMNYWRRRYVEGKIETCRRNEDADELKYGIQFLNNKFDKFVKRKIKYFRFADNMVFLHEDKVFEHILCELAIMHLARDFLLNVNKEWNVRPVEGCGIDICGYVFFHDHIRLRKRNKVSLCKQVANLRKKGYSQRDIELRCASRVGFAMHGDTKMLLKKLKMENRLGKVISRRRKKAPFDGMDVDQKQSIENIICHIQEVENDKLIQLIDFNIADSIIDKEENGVPRRRIAIRYRNILRVENEKSDDPEYVWAENEMYAFSGSKIMIEQAEKDFSKEDLPIATVIKEFTNERHKKFYKFT